MTTAPASPPLTACGLPEGMRQIPPGPSVRVSAPTRKTTDPDHDPELLVVVLVLGQLGPGLHLNHCQRQPLAVNSASEIAFREQLRWDRMQVLECAHRPSPRPRRTRRR